MFYLWPIQPPNADRRSPNIAKPLVLSLSDGATATADIVVGADGAWSRIRKALSNIKPSYAGLTFVDTRIIDIDEKHPELASYLGNGSLLAIDDNKVCSVLLPLQTL